MGMVRKAKTKRNASKMYRHFAVVTVAITVAVALMADSESRSEIVTAVEDHHEQIELQKQSDAIVASGSLIDNSNSGGTVGSFGDDSWVGTPGSGASSSIHPASQQTKGPPWVRLGISQADFEMLSAEERERLLAELEVSQPDEATMARISEQSMRRAGRTEPSADAPRGAAF